MRLNIITSLTLQIITLITGLILPRLILTTFGSEVNGLVSSINQFLGYVNLLEGGVASVMLANLYKPLYDQDDYKLSRVFKTTLSFFRKLGLIFIIYQLAVATFYPLVFKTNFDYIYVFSLVMILGINTFTQYVFSFTNKLLLNASNRLYITNLIQIIILILNTILVIIGLKVYPNIHFIKLITASVYLIQPIAYKYFVKKYFNIDKKAEIDNSLIQQRWDGFGINIAAFMHNNTDIVILTLFTNLEIVSVYTVYMLVINGVKSLLMSILSSYTPTLGKFIAKGDKKELNEFFDKYEFIAVSLVFLAFTVCGLLIVPFVMNYTSSLNDMKYYQPIFAFIMVLAEWSYCVRDPYINVAYQAGHFKQISKYAYTEAILNIVISIICVIKFGIVGVAMGTLVSMTYRTIAQVVYLEKNILYRSKLIFFKYCLLFSLIPILSVYIISHLSIYYYYTISNFVILLFISGIVTILLYGIIVLVFYKKRLKIKK